MRAWTGSETERQARNIGTIDRNQRQPALFRHDPPKRGLLMNRSLAPLAIAAGLLGLAACSTLGVAPDGASSASAAADGRFVAVSRCASCHAIDSENFSPRPDAPALKTVAWRYGTKLRAETLMDGMHVGHKEMPHIDLSSVETDALVAYLNSLSDYPASK